MVTALGAILRQRREPIIASMIAHAHGMNAAQGISLPEEEVRRRTSATLDAFIKAISGDAPSEYSDFWREISYARFRAGVQLDHMHRVFRWSNAAIRRALHEALDLHAEEQREAIELCVGLAEEALLSLHSAYEQAKEELIRAQRAEIRRLSTPILPVYTGVLVLPLIGVIDEERASDMIERTLGEVTRARAASVIIDVTGVPVIDNAVVDHLLRVARTSELLGARAVFVGVRPSTARALVQSGADLRGLVTFADLKSGVEYALRAQGLAIGRRA